MRFKVGHLYVVDYDDHWSVDESYRSHEKGKPPRLRQRGLCIFNGPRVVVIEHNTNLDDEGDLRSDRHGILKSAIVRVQHLGKER